MISIDLSEQKSNPKRRRALRGKKNSTEQILWSGLRKKQLQRFKFRRQFGFGVFILDFYCQKSRLAVEIVRDDRVRDRRDEYARRRRQYIELYEIAIMQITASEVCNNLDGVLARISEVARRRSGAHIIPHYQLHPLQSTPRENVVVPLG